MKTIFKGMKFGWIRGEAGVTLLEAMATTAIAAILAVIGIPGLIDLVRDVRRDGAVSEIVAALNFARSEAIRHNHQVTACPSATGLDCNNNRLWESGWIVFTDPNSNGTVDGGEAILRVHSGTAGAGTVRGAHVRVTYQSTGFSPFFNDTLRVCDERGTEYARRVIISNMGRVRVQNRSDVCP